MVWYCIMYGMVSCIEYDSVYGIMSSIVSCIMYGVWCVWYVMVYDMIT